MPFRKHASLVVVADGHTSVTEQLGGAVHRGTLERRARGLRTPAVEVGVTLRSTPEAPWLGRTPCWDRAFGEVIRSEGGPWGGPGSWRPGALPRCDGAQRQTCMAGEDVWGTRATRGGGGSPRDARRGWEVTRAKRGHGLPAPSQPQRGPARRQAPSTTGPRGGEATVLQSRCPRPRAPLQSGGLGSWASSALCGCSSSLEDLARSGGSSSADAPAANSHRPGPPRPAEPRGDCSTPLRVVLTSVSDGVRRR